VEAHEYPLCLEKRIGVITYSSLARGLLAGKYTTSQQFEDQRAKNPRFQGKVFERFLQGIEDIKPFAENYGLTIAQLAVRWVLTHPAVSSAIIGVKKPEHIKRLPLLQMEYYPTATGML
jgi:aryl-alcohol dehydrogenase-like predicted oxidoreductase